jgi:class 3 adenylate cyclase
VAVLPAVYVLLAPYTRLQRALDQGQTVQALDRADVVAALCLPQRMMALIVAQFVLSLVAMPVVARFWLPGLANLYRDLVPGIGAFAIVCASAQFYSLNNLVLRRVGPLFLVDGTLAHLGRVPIIRVWQHLWLLGLTAGGAWPALLYVLYLRAERSSWIGVALLVVSALALFSFQVFSVVYAVALGVGHLNERMAMVRDGDLGVRASLRGLDTLSEMAGHFNAMVASLQQRNDELVQTNAAIARFVPFGFLRALGRRSVAEVQRGDARRRDVAILFCDLRGFTTMAEGLGPEATFRFINDYLARMEPAIHGAGGFINQYLGDGIMALFPSSEPARADGGDGDDGAGVDGGVAAVDAVLAMGRALDALNAERQAEGLAPVAIGIGVHVGEVMIGTIGGGTQLDGGVVGDVVNTASRLEGMTKMYGVRALVSGAVAARLARRADAPALRALDSVRARGKRTPLPIFEVLAVDAAADRKRATAAAFVAAQTAYRAGDFATARDGFAAVLATHPDDGAARFLLEQATALAAAPPADWDGVTTLLQK